MPGEGKLPGEGEDPDPIVGLLGRGRKQEGGLREVDPSGELLHLIGGQILGVHDHGERVPGQWSFAEDVDKPDSAAHVR
jgi:hypothetical protein